MAACAAALAAGAPCALGAAGGHEPPRRAVAAYITGYSFWDNTPPASPVISHPAVHARAGGTGTYADPVTVAVGHSITDGRERLDWSPGTRFYVPYLRKYLVVEDTCGDGPEPQRGPCHTGYPARASTWLDVWSGGRGLTPAAAERCLDTFTGVHTVIVSPGRGRPVVRGPLIHAGRCPATFREG